MFHDDHHSACYKICWFGCDHRGFFLRERERKKIMWNTISFIRKRSWDYMLKRSIFSNDIFFFFFSSPLCAFIYSTRSCLNKILRIFWPFDPYILSSSSRNVDGGVCVKRKDIFYFPFCELCIKRQQQRVQIFCWFSFSLRLFFFFFASSSSFASNSIPKDDNERMQSHMNMYDSKSMFWCVGVKKKKPKSNDQNSRLGLFLSLATHTWMLLSYAFFWNTFKHLFSLRFFALFCQTGFLFFSINFPTVL